MYHPFSLILRNINVTIDEYDEDDECGKVVVGWMKASVYGKLEPGCVVRIEVDSDGDVCEMNVIDDGDEVDGYIFRTDDNILSASLTGRVLVWNDRDYGSVVAVLKNELPDMTFEEE